MPRSKQGLVRLLRRQGVDRRVVDAFSRVDRRDFVPADAVALSYVDRPVALPDGQTTSQPSLIARMIEAVLPPTSDSDRADSAGNAARGRGKALEIGTGYGFQTALLAQLFARVVSVERIEGLAGAARENLERVGIGNVQLCVGDGWRGAPAEMPFEAIIVSAAASEVPLALKEQLAEGGRLVIPVARPTSDDVMVYEKRSGEVHELRLLTPARFVPLVAGAEAQAER